MSRICDRGIRCVVSVVAACVFSVAGGTSTAQELPTFDVIVIAQYPDFYPSDLNNRGEVVGTNYYILNGSFYGRAARWSDGVLTRIEFDPSVRNPPVTTNDNGQIMGWVEGSIDGVDQLYLFNSFDDIVYPYLSDLFDRDVQPSDINNTGQFTGRHRVVDSLKYKPFFFDGERVHQLVPEGASEGEATGLNDLGQIVGHYDVPTGVYFYTDRYGFVWSDGARIPIGTVDERVSPTDINESSQVIGQATLFNENLQRAFLYEGGELHNLGTLGGSSSAALSINNNGWIVGESATGQPLVYSHAFAVINDFMYDLNDLVPNDLEWELTRAEKVNDRGQILAFGEPKEGSGLTFLLLTPSVVDTVEEMIELVESYGLPKGIENSFLVKLEHALEAIEEGDVERACNQLTAFANHVIAQAGKKLTEEQAEELLEGVENVRVAIGCP